MDICGWSMTLPSIWSAFAGFVWAAAPIAVAFSAMRIAAAQYAGSEPVAMVRVRGKGFKRDPNGNPAGRMDYVEIEFWNHRKYPVELVSATIRAQIPIITERQIPDEPGDAVVAGHAVIRRLEKTIAPGENTYFTIRAYGRGSKPLGPFEVSLYYLDPRKGKFRRMWLPVFSDSSVPWRFWLVNRLRVSRFGPIKSIAQRYTN